MRNLLLLIILCIVIVSSCGNNEGCYVFYPGDTIETVERDESGIKILMKAPADDVIFESVSDSSQAQIYLNKAHRIQNDVYGPYRAKLFKMSLKDRYELLTVLDSVYRERMFEERLWHVQKVNGLTGEKSIEYKWY